MGSRREQEGTTDDFELSAHTPLSVVATRPAAVRAFRASLGAVLAGSGILVSKTIEQVCWGPCGALEGVWRLCVTGGLLGYVGWWAWRCGKGDSVGRRNCFVVAPQGRRRVRGRRRRLFGVVRPGPGPVRQHCVWRGTVAGCWGSGWRAATTSRDQNRPGCVHHDSTLGRISPDSNCIHVQNMVQCNQHS